jgi:hypothetical protein
MLGAADGNPTTLYESFTVSRRENAFTPANEPWIALPWYSPTPYYRLDYTPARRRPRILPRRPQPALAVVGEGQARADGFEVVGRPQEVVGVAAHEIGELHRLNQRPGVGGVLRVGAKGLDVL